MTKTKFYEVSKVMEMVELILNKFYNDMDENHIIDSVSAVMKNISPSTIR